jgi:pyridoxine 5-phosphate synthase
MILGVNVDHIATLRNARGGMEPDPVRGALVCEKAGAHSIVMHLREDRRHIKDRDLFRAKEALKIRLNMEMSIAPGIVKIAMRLKPHQATLVPEKRREMTTEGGLDLKGGTPIKRVIDRLKGRGIEVSLFIDPDLKQIERAKNMGADAVEFHTGDYANAMGAAKLKEWKRLKNGALFAGALRLKAHAGHGLDYDNVQALKKIQGLEELNIGYAIITRSLWTGLDKAVRDMRALIK